jgi:acyl carrier protein
MNREQIIENFFIDRNGPSVRGILSDCDLFEEGLLDSLDLVALAALIERDFGIRIDVTDDAVLKKFRRLEGILGMIR